MIRCCIFTNGHALSLSGPISVVMLTSFIPKSAKYNAFSKHISSLRSSFFSPRRNKALSLISIHLLYVPALPSSSHSRNAYINLARLYASTNAIMLFPGGVAELPSRTLYHSLLADRSSSPLIIPRHSSSSYRPTAPATSILTSFSSDIDRTLPFHHDAALFVIRSDPLWCTERFFLSHPTAVTRLTTYPAYPMEWTECLWQFWLAYPDAVDLTRTVVDSWGATSGSHNDFQHEVLVNGEGNPRDDGESGGKATSTAVTASFYVRLMHPFIH